MSQISPTHPRRLADIDTWHAETDVAVVGFGGAGGCAAIEAADAGAQVTIFEVAAASGGWFLYRSVRLFQERTDEAAQGVFRVSLAFLFAVFLALLVDLVVAAL